MAAIYKRKCTKVVNGQKLKRQSKCWYVKYRDADGIERRVKGYADKEATRQMAARLEKEAALAQEGVVDRYKEHRAKPLKEHLEDFRQSLLAKGNTAKHAEMTFTRAQTVIDRCGCVFWNDIEASKIERCLAELRAGEKGKSVQTSNFYLQAVKQFCRWMAQNRRASESPIAHMRRMNVKVDRRHDRVSFEVDEVRRLLTATHKGPERFGMSGPERALLYRLTVESGLRANELRTLKVSSFDLSACTVKVVAAYSKHRQEDVLPLRPETAEELRIFFAGKMPEAKAFGGRYKSLTDRTAEMIQEDLAATVERDESGNEIRRAISYTDTAGRYRDFHALRHTTGSWLAANGVHPKVAQTIMRHSDINLTMSRYTHTLRGQEAEAVRKLPDLSLAGSAPQEAVATGTDGKPTTGREQVTPKVTPQLTPAAFPALHGLSSIGTSESQEPSITVNHKCFSDEKLGTDRDRLATSVIAGGKLRPEGLEPPTIGSEDRGSIQLSYGRSDSADIPEGRQAGLFDSPPLADPSALLTAYYSRAGRGRQIKSGRRIPRLCPWARCRLKCPPPTISCRTDRTWRHRTRTVQE